MYFMDTQFLKELFKIPAKERLELAEFMLESIEKESIENKNFWIDEVERRMESHKNGDSSVMDFMQKYDTD